MGVIAGACIFWAKNALGYGVKLVYNFLQRAFPRAARLCGAAKQSSREELRSNPTLNPRVLASQELSLGSVATNLPSVNFQDSVMPVVGSRSRAMAKVALDREVAERATEAEEKLAIAQELILTERSSISARESSLRAQQATLYARELAFRNGIIPPPDSTSEESNMHVWAEAQRQKNGRARNLSYPNSQNLAPHTPFNRGVFGPRVHRKNNSPTASIKVQYFLNFRWLKYLLLGVDNWWGTFMSEKGGFLPDPNF